MNISDDVLETTVVENEAETSTNGVANNDEDLFDIHLCSLNPDKSDKWAIVGKAWIKLLSSDVNKEPLEANIGPVVFNAKNTVWTYDSFVNWGEIMKPENSYVTDDSCMFEMKIQASMVQDTSIDELMKFEMLRKCCDNSTVGKFRLTINKLQESYGICSPEIILNGEPWRILVVKGRHLELFIRGMNANADVDKEQLSVATIQIKLKSFDPAVAPVCKLLKDFNFDHSLCEYSSKLISWKELIKREKKFISNGSFVLEVEVKFNHPEDSQNNKIDLVCPICLGNMKNNSMSTTRCGHLFCLPCIEQSLEINPICPSCKKATKLDDIIKIKLVYGQVKES